MNKRYISMLAVVGLVSFSAIAQQKIIGVVRNAQGNPVLGAIVSTVGNPTQKSFTDQEGLFTLEAEQGQYIEVVYADNLKKRVWIDDKPLNICLDEKAIVVDNHGKVQSTDEQTQAISTISGKQLQSNSGFKVSNALFGMIPGLEVIQNTGWDKGATLRVRGGVSLSATSPLIVVDGMPRSSNYLNNLAIESVSVLKDGAATALWGTRGSNGVIVITTKRGQYNSRDINVNFTYGMGFPINQPNFIDGYTYALMKNEALYYDGLPLAFDQVALNKFRDGTDRDAFADTDWMGEALRNHTSNNQLNLSFRGGGNRLRYFSAINYSNDYGILNKNIANYSERYNAQMKKYRLDARMNIDIDVTDHTQVVVNVFGLMHENTRPRTSEADIFSGLFHAPSGAFSMKNSTGEWGSDNIYKYNPIGRIADVGYYRTDERLLQTDLRIYQDLSVITKGLKAELGISYDNNAVYQETGSKNYAYEAISVIPNLITGEYQLIRTQGGDNSALSVENSNLASQFMRTILDGKMGYDRAFGLHVVNGTLQYRQESYIPLSRNTTRKRQSYIFTGGYNYADRYLVDVVTNASGTSVLSDNNYFRFYPAVSAAWLVSNESFWKINNYMDYLKVRISWGRSGNDNIKYDLDERYWENSGGGLFKDNPTGFGGLHPGTLAVRNLDIERADKYNIGLDVRFFKRLNVTVDAFYDQRKKILISADNLYSSVIGTGIPQQNIGSVKSGGIDLSLNWKDKIGKDFNYYAGLNFSYLDTEIVENGEGYRPYDYLSHKGNKVGQIYGLEAIGYFRDEADIAENPKQMFSQVRPGDIKYKDQNGDNKIDNNDEVSIGHSSTLPGLYYGINLGFEYKNFGLDMVLQGVGQYSRMLNTKSVYWPLRNNNSNMSDWYFTNGNIRWTEATKDNANLPRLTSLDNANNFRNSTQWLENGAYFKLRNLNIYYNLPQKWLEKIKVDKCQVYVRSNNLFSLDHVKYMNSEDLTINYPDLLSVFVGVNINF